MCISSFSEVLEASRRRVKFPQSLKQLELYYTSTNTCGNIGITSFSDVREQQEQGCSSTMAPAGRTPTMPKLGKQSRAVTTIGLINNPGIIKERQGNKSHPRSNKEIQITIQEQQGRRLKA